MDKSKICTNRMATVDCFEIDGEKFKVEFDTTITGPDFIIKSNYDEGKDFDHLRYIAQHSHFRMFRECLDLMKKEGEKDNCAKDRVRKSIEKVIYNERAKKDFTFYEDLKELVSSVASLVYDHGELARKNSYVFLEKFFGITQESFNDIYLKCVTNTQFILRKGDIDPVVNFRSFLVNGIVEYIRQIPKNRR